MVNYIIIIRISFFLIAANLKKIDCAVLAVNTRHWINFCFDFGSKIQEDIVIIICAEIGEISSKEYLLIHKAKLDV